ncbi:hypothetical protein EYF80_034071 [Liparis tanakae]|uniref:Uncharacterized protein n=1 Tax=Liparis tanakae TaxID=230148 RepID=A0A4Z2GQG6_9TELE|nr:hypothetical protein EYF80_034071 [Liparis tanakae]
MHLYQRSQSDNHIAPMSNEKLNPSARQWEGEISTAGPAGADGPITAEISLGSVPPRHAACIARSSAPRSRKSRLQTP